MKRKITALLVLLLFLSCMLPTAVQAEGQEEDFNWEDYTLEELVIIRDQINAVIEKKQIEYAIEHGDRAISLPGDAIVYVGGTFSAEATVERIVDSAPDETELIWTSSDDKIVTVTNQGVISGLSEGDAVISCRAADNEYIFAEMPIKCVLPVAAVSLDEEKTVALLFEGKECGLQLSCTISPENAYCKDVEWSSNNEAVATVNDAGYVSFLSAGNVTITAKSKDGFSEKPPKEARCTITVALAASNIELDQENIVMNRGSAATIKATIFPANVSNKTMLWESSDPDIVSVKNGQLKAIACGSATITCSAADGSGAEAVCKVDVVQMVTGIKFLDVSSAITLDRGDSMQLNVDLLPADASNKGITWESSDNSVVSVTENGKIVAQKGGTATITCSSTDGSEKRSSINVYVPSIAVDEEQYVVTSKAGLSFDVSFYGKNSDFEIIPASNAFFRTSKSQSGNTITITITPLKAGKANITLKDKSDKKSDRIISIIIDHEAVYDTTAYPVFNHSDILRNPDQYKGDAGSIYGKVLQTTESGGFLSPKKINLRVGTTGYGYYDKVFWVTIDPSILDQNIIEDDMITVFGTCSGSYSYTALFGNSITIPAITAEKVILEKN